MSNQVHLGWDKVKVGDRVKYHSPVQGNHIGIIVKIHEEDGCFGRKDQVYIQPMTTYGARKGEVTHDLMTVNHSLWEIF